MSRAWLAPIGVAWIAAAPGCFSPELTPGLPCAMDHDPPCPIGQVCDEALNTCVPDSALGTWRDDSSTDFATPGAILEDAAIEANGAVGPTPYFVQGVAIHGIDAPMIGLGNETTVGWDDIASAPTAGRGFWRGDLELDFSGEAPGTGLTNLGGVTVRIEGEIFLDAGDTDFDLDCDDRGFFDVRDPATGVFTRVVTAAQGPSANGTVSVAVEGWYPFHGAVETDGGAVRYDLHYDVGDGMATVEADRLRARVDDASGLALDGFDDPYMHGPTGTTLSTEALGQRQDYGNASFPPDLGALGVGTWSVRWSGQVLVDVTGTYSFRLDTQGGHRMWLDGAQVADSDDAEGALVTTTPAVDLDAGWHDIVIDTMKDSDSSTPAHFQITVADGPELVGDFFPVDRQRPVPGRGARFALGGSGSTVAIPDVGSATKSVFLDLPPGVSTALLVDYDYAFTHPVQSSVSIEFDRPAAAQTILIPAGTLTGTGPYSSRLRFDDVTADGSWQLIAADNLMDVMTGSITSARIAATYTGGPAPFPRLARYTSEVRNLGTVIAYSGVRWQLRQARGAQVVVSVRSCADPTCTGVAWTAVPASGAVAGIPALPFAQYQVEIATDGDIATALDWIEIDYRL